MRVMHTVNKFIGLGVLAALLLIAARVVPWLLEYNSEFSRLAAINGSITPYPQAEILYQGECSGGGNGSPSLSCRITRYCTLIGVRDENAPINQYYLDYLTQAGWENMGGDGYQHQTDGTYAELLGDTSHVPSGPSLPLPYAELAQYSQEYAQLRVLKLFTRSAGCPQSP